jgi:hypothetical protein
VLLRFSVTMGFGVGVTPSPGQRNPSSRIVGFAKFGEPLTVLSWLDHTSKFQILKCD